MVRNVLMLLSILSLETACNEKKVEKTQPEVTIISENLRFSEGSIVDDSMFLFSNFGSSELNPLGTEGKGYITRLVNDKIEKFIPADGNLDSPKGMAINNGKLYIADVAKVVIYDLDRRGNAPQIIKMPEGNLFVNDIVIYGQSAYISVTNTGKIFKLDLSTQELTEYANVPGANGLVMDGKTMYIASYPPDGETTNDNVIYVIEDVNSPIVAKLIDRPGQYDGIALKGSKLYFTSWVNSEIGYVDLSAKMIILLDLADQKISGPADISIKENVLYIPDLPNSRILKVKL